MISGIMGFYWSGDSRVELGGTISIGLFDELAPHTRLVSPVHILILETEINILCEVEGIILDQHRWSARA